MDVGCDPFAGFAHIMSSEEIAERASDHGFIVWRAIAALASNKGLQKFALGSNAVNLKRSTLDTEK